jgi:hypothetical protein
MEAFMAGGAGIERSPEHYIDFREVAPSMLADAASKLSDGDPVPEADLRSVGRVPADLRMLPIVSRRGEGTMLVDAKSGQPLRVLSEP